VYFITDFKYNCISNFLVESPFFQDNVLLTRLNILPSFISYLKQKSDQRLTDTYQVPSKITSSLLPMIDLDNPE
jgi:hypothetical protein